MNRRISLPAVVAVVAIMLLSGDSSAQQPGRYVPPAGNTITPYLNYFRRDVGVLDPYNSLVRPRLQLESDLNAIARQQQANMQATQAEIGQIRAATAAPTGVGGGFMNYSHYYQQMSRPQRARTSRY